MSVSSGFHFQTFLEKTIKITQNPGSSKGFGFHVSGGKENAMPIVVHKVTLGNARYVLLELTVFRV